MLSNHKGGYTIELNDAVWMMEAVFNYYHGFTGESYLVTTTDSTFIPVAYSGFNDVPIDELQQLFVQANNAIVASFEAYPGQNKKTYMFDLELQSTQQGSQLLVMTTTGTVDNKKSGAGIGDPRFGDDDYWTLITYNRCDGLWSDANLNAEGKWRNALISHYHRYFSIWSISDISYSEIIYYDDYPISSVPFSCAENYRLYKGSNACMTPEMMNFYYSQFIYIVNDREPAQKTMADINIHTRYPYAPDYDYEVDCKIKYGVISFTPDKVPCHPEPL